MKLHHHILFAMLNVGCVHSAQQLRSTLNQQEFDSPTDVVTKHPEGSTLDKQATPNFQRRLPFGPIGPNVEQEGEQESETPSAFPSAAPSASSSAFPSVAPPSPVPSAQPTGTPTNDPTQPPTPDPLGPPIVLELPQISTSDMAKVMNWIKHEVSRDATAFCWRESYGRGVGSIPDRCPPGKEMIGALCYTKCPSGTFAYTYMCR